MSRAWMPIYWGDYLRDTRDLTTLQHGAYLLLIAHYWQHERLPTDEKQLAAIAGLTVSKWRAIEAPIRAKFQDEWHHKRIDDELERMERKINQRIIAGRAGGTRSGISRAIKQGEQLKRSLSCRSSESQTGGEHSRTNHQVLITSTELDAAEESAEGQGVASAELTRLIRRA